MQLAEIGFELAAAQLLRRSLHGLVPKIMQVTFQSLDDVGRRFFCRATFSWGADFLREFELDNAVDLADGDWPARFDFGVFGDQQRWPQ